MSPITGKTGPILIQPGNLVIANTTTSPLVTITQLQPIKVSMFLPQTDLARIQQGLGRIDAITTAEAAAHRDLANYIFTSARQK